MNISVLPQQKGIDLKVKCTPEVVITLSFQPVCMAKSYLEKRLKEMLEQAETHILAHCTMQQTLPVFARLQNLVNNLNFYTNKKSIALFASPAFERTFYLDFEVEDRVMIDGNFKLTDIARFRKPCHLFLVLLLQENGSSIYLGDQFGLQIIKRNKKNDVEKHLGYTDLFYPLSYLPIKVIDQYLLKIDRDLSLVMGAHPYPVFVMGEEKLVEHFKLTTVNKYAIAGFDFLQPKQCNKEGLHHTIKTYLGQWDKIAYHFLVRKITKAKNEKKLAWGTQSIWKNGIQKKALLFAEEGYIYPQPKKQQPHYFYHVPKSFNSSFYITDAADEVAEKVLEAEGSLHVLPAGSLTEFGHLVLVSS